MPNNTIFTFKMGGMAGQGVKSVGITLAKVATRSGYYIYTHTEYPSLIRGGHNVMQISISSEPVKAAFYPTHFLIAFNQDTIDYHHPNLTDDAGVLYDSSKNINASTVKKTVQLFPTPLQKLAIDCGGNQLMSNTVALGASIALLGGNLNYLKDLITEEFKDKKEEVIKLNHATAQAGYDYIHEYFKKHIIEVLKPLGQTQPQMVINGNQACAMGAIAAGLQFAAIYPMTPTSNLLHILAPLQEKYHFIYKQPEDEIAAINMAIGAAWGGARALVATSGGGFCLMSEGYGLAGISETPLVIIEGMRGAPATGLPTWTEQGDLRFVLHAHQGDFPRIVLAAGDAEEIFHLTMKAFNLADKYQTPVLILVDKHICENDQSFHDFDYSEWQLNRGEYTRDKIDNYQRYAPNETGISLRSIPGSGNHFLATSDEHDSYGYSNEDAKNRNNQMKKRMQKLLTCSQEDMQPPQLFGPEEADVTIVSWGSNKGAIIEAIKSFSNVNFLHLTWINPFPVEAVRNILLRAKYLINIECNFTGQMHGLIKEHTGIDILDQLLKYDGRPIYPEEIVAKIHQALDHPYA